MCGNAHTPLMRTPLRYLIAAACLMAGSFAFAAEETKAEPKADEAKAAAQAWLKLIDDEKYEDSWKDAASAFQARVTAAVWSEKLSQVRRPLGHTEKREFKDASFVHELPRLPKGDYWHIEYATSIESTAVNELVTLVLDKDGKWHVLSYQIKPAQ
jgi:hypothetical protein